MSKNGKSLLITITTMLLSPGLLLGANINDLSDRVETLESNIELLEEVNEDLRDELDNKMQISGYVDVEYVRTKQQGSAVDHGFRMHHLSLFFKKNISEKWRFFSEIEYEDAPKFDNENAGTISIQPVDSAGAAGDPIEIAKFTDAFGKIFVEAVSMDYFWSPEATFRFGRFFTPAGIWSVDHYPPFVTTQQRPTHIRKIFPQIVDGAMTYGTIEFSRHFLKYNVYVGNGEKNDGHDDNDTGKAWGVKTSVDLSVPYLSRFEVGASTYYDANYGSTDKSKTAFGLHAKAKKKAIEFQAEMAFAKFEDSNSGTRKGYYAQLNYAPNQWSVGYRYDYYSEGGLIVDRIINSVFVNYRISTNIVIKLEQHLQSEEAQKDITKTIFSVVGNLE